MISFISEMWAHITALITFVVTVSAAFHAVIYKRDSRSALGWTALIVFFPFFGAVLYVLLGINRIQRKASAFSGKHARQYHRYDDVSCSKKNLHNILTPANSHLTTLNRVVSKITHRPLLCGNHLTPLKNGDEAYPVMINAINTARKTITLATYIFSRDRAGEMFINALSAAAARGVDVRVLIDDVGSRYTFPPIVRYLQKRGINTASFMPTSFPWRTAYINLRNHRKILVVDGIIGFTGGMNIRRYHILNTHCSHHIQDLHFRVTGPVVRHLQEAFSEDWYFTTEDVLSGPEWFPDLHNAGSTIARGITHGPDEDIDNMHNVILSALSCARRSIRIVTPYFLPDIRIISALNVACLRGVDVDVIVPAVNNLRLVGWAMSAQFWQVLKWGCRIWMSPPPFDHTKFMVVDNTWCLIGSSNWDARSLRLNFEFNVECYSPELGQWLCTVFDEKRSSSREMSLSEADSRPLLIKLRDGMARLCTPYL